MTVAGFQLVEPLNSVKPTFAGIMVVLSTLHWKKIHFYTKLKMHKLSNCTKTRGNVRTFCRS
jgi:hypothetical protein